MRELDGILTAQHHYIMEWYPPSHRFAYWNKFGMPTGTFSRMGDADGSLAPGMPQLWWIDPQKAQRLEQAMKDKSMKMDVPPVEDRYWHEYSQKEQNAQASPEK